MLFQEIRQKPFEYLFLLSIFIFGLSGFVYFSHLPSIQRRVIYLTGASYLFWSLLHHYRRGDLVLSIVLEYLIVALFAFILISATLI